MNGRGSRIRFSFSVYDNVATNPDRARAQHYRRRKLPPHRSMHSPNNFGVSSPAVPKKRVNRDVPIRDNVISLFNISLFLSNLRVLIIKTSSYHSRQQNNCSIVTVKFLLLLSSSSSSSSDEYCSYNANSTGREIRRTN